MLTRCLTFLAVLVCCLAPAWAEEKTAEKAAPPIKALYLTGGGWHKYDKLEPMVTEGVAKNANIVWTKRSGIEALSDPKVADDCDVIVCNFCYSGELDKDKTPLEVLENVLKPIRAGKPAVLLHATMHSFADVPAWTEMCGQKSRQHESYHGFTCEKADPNSPITKLFPDNWKTKGDELYKTIDFPKDSHALLKAKGNDSDKENVICWTSEYGKGRVFGCTLGHDAKSASDPDYHKLVASGLLWSCGKLADDGQPAAGYAAPKK